MLTNCRNSSCTMLIQLFEVNRTVKSHKTCGMHWFSWHLKPEEDNCSSGNAPFQKGWGYDKGGKMVAFELHVNNSSTAWMPYLQHIIGWLTVLAQRLLGNSHLSWGRKWAGNAGPLGTPFYRERQPPAGPLSPVNGYLRSQRTALIAEAKQFSRTI